MLDQLTPDVETVEVLWGQRSAQLFADRPPCEASFILPGLRRYRGIVALAGWQISRQVGRQEVGA